MQCLFLSPFFTHPRLCSDASIHFGELIVLWHNAGFARGEKMVRKEVELLGAVGVGVCAEYGSLVHKHVEEAANSHFLHEIS